MSDSDKTDKQVLSASQVSAHDGLDDWRVLLDGLHARFATGSFSTGLALVNRIGEAAEEAGHHPDLDLRFPHLNVKLTSHDVGGLTMRDVRMARRISEFAAEAGVPAAPADAQTVEVALNASDHTRLRPFWAAVLGMSENGDEVTDKAGALPTMWFQPTEDLTEGAMRFHLDVTVPHDVAEQRVADGVAAGGTLVDDSFAPAFWVLADPEGNKVCVCTWQGRESS